MSKAISPSEVSAHATVENGLYIIIDGNVYGLASFVDEHPVMIPDRYLNLTSN